MSAQLGRVTAEAVPTGSQPERQDLCHLVPGATPK